MVAVYIAAHNSSQKRKLIKGIVKKKIAFILFLLINCSAAQAQKNRVGDIGIHFDGTAGKFNAVSDVKALEVGYSTTIFLTGKNI